MVLGRRIHRVYRDENHSYGELLPNWKDIRLGDDMSPPLFNVSLEAAFSRLD